MTYNDYLIKITNTMQIRSTDYRLSQNDITIMANNIYNEIAAECSLDFLKQEVTIDIDTDTYDLDALYVQTGTEVAMDVMSIKDDNGLDVTHWFRNVGGNTYQVNSYLEDSTNELFLKEYDTRVITFNRKIIPDIEDLDHNQQTLLFNAIIEGIMWYTHDAIPNPTSSQAPAVETDAHYKRYLRAIEVVKNQLPQRI